MCILDNHTFKDLVPKLMTPPSVGTTDAFASGTVHTHSQAAGASGCGDHWVPDAHTTSDAAPGVGGGGREGGL